ncbi:MAG: hypothetical protein J7K51_05995 [Thermotogae bacterium]|nr:hypothetical protein [Thermotogota bacterium]
MRSNEILELYRGGRFMSLSLKERRAVVKEISVRYKKVKKKEKGKILDEFVKLTGYNRCYSSYLLRTYEKKVVIYGQDGIRRVFIADNEYRGRKNFYYAISTTREHCSPIKNTKGHLGFLLF